MDRYFLKSNAFSLIELSVVMGAMAILSTAIIPMTVRAVEIKAAEKTIAEIAIIQSSAKKYFHDQKQWPQNLQDMQSLGYLAPGWSLLNPWSRPYIIESDDKKFGVTTSVPANLTKMLAFRLNQSSVNDTNVTSMIPSEGGNNIASGVIVAWSGTIADIPIGWVLCDGSNNTPDLRDKFIVGARVDDFGVAKTNILGSLMYQGGNISHDHGAETGPHALTIEEMPRHHHGYMATPWTGSRYDGRSSPLMTQQVKGQTDDAGGDLPHTHPINADFNVPPFYALAFIMKI